MYNVGYKIKSADMKAYDICCNCMKIMVNMKWKRLTNRQLLCKWAESERGQGVRTTNGESQVVTGFLRNTGT